jgi:hypothetical protein
MKYSSWSLMLDTVLALPFLVAGVVVVCGVREAIHRYEEMQIIDKISYYHWSQDDPYEILHP